MYNEDEDDYETSLEAATDHIVMPAWGWRRYKDSQGLVNQLAIDLSSPGGGTKTIIRLAWLGKPALAIMEKAIEQADIPRSQVARDYEGEGEFSSPMGAIMAGSEVWLKWLLKNGADPRWRDFGGKTLISHLFRPQYLNSLMDDEPIGKRTLTPSVILRWARGQQRCATFLQKYNKGKLWDSLMVIEDMNGRTAKDHFEANLDQLLKARWFERLDEEDTNKVRRDILGALAPPKPTVRNKKPAM